MGTVRDLIHQSAMLAGMRASGEVLDATTAQDVLTVLNQLIDSWNLASLMIYQIERVIVPMVASQQTYTVGPGGQFNMVRPVTLHSVSWRDEAVFPPLELPLHEMEQWEYEGLRVRETPSSMPTRFYYDEAFPLARLFVYPKPSMTKQLVLYPWHLWNSQNTLDTVVSYPPGYERMLVHNLAVELGQQPGARLTPATIQIALDSKALVESQNVQVPILNTDYPAPSSYGRFNFYTLDESR